jgi:non-specific serine/threonine protein kinase
MRQIANHPKMAVEAYAKGSGKFEDVLEHWETIQKGGHKVLIFSSFVQHLELYRQEFEGHQQPYAWLTGSQSSKERERAIHSFMEKPEVQPFLISIKSGGTGLNLTAADYVFILDPWWNPTTEQQAIARAHRIGQDKHVIAIKFITKDTIEEKILRLQEKKSKLAEDIIGDVEKAKFSKGDIEYLFG